MERVVYILTPRGRSLECSLRLTRLMKWGAFSEADVSELKVLFSKKYEAYLEPEDRPIVVGLMQLVKREGQWPVLDGEYGHELLRKMLQRRSAFFAFGNHRPLRWGESLAGELGWSRSPGSEDQWETELALANGARAFAVDPPVYIDGDACTCGLVETGHPPRFAGRWLSAGRMAPPQASVFCLRLAKAYPEERFPTPECARLEDSAADAVAARARLTVQQRGLTRQSERDEAWIDLAERLRLRLRFQYGKAMVDWDAPESAVSYREGAVVKRVARDKAWEQSVLQQLEQWGFAPSSEPPAFGSFNFDSSTFFLREGASWRRLLETTFPALEAGRWEIDWEKGLDATLLHDSDVYLEIEDEGGDHFALSIDVAADGRREPILPALRGALQWEARRGYRSLLQWLRSGSFALRLYRGEGKSSLLLAVLPDGLAGRWAERLFELFDSAGVDGRSRARINRWRLGELAAEGMVAEDCAEGVSRLARLCERVGAGVEVAPRAAPKGLGTALRDYQAMGLGWLWALEEVEAGGLLADDMGLGKTAQTIAHLLDLKQRGRLGQGALVVAPTSVIDNWEDELQRFAPSLEVVRYHGKDRESAWRDGASPDVLLTTYALLRLDCERLQARRWSLAVLDEAQYLKNAASRVAAAARGLRARRTLCLTGTPIENRLEDIWSLFECVLPGFLGDEATFRQRVAQPLKESEDSELARELRERLKRRLRPFVLRRSKNEVLADLPERTEVIESVSMEPLQRDLYDSLRQEAREAVGQSMATHGVAGSRMLILSRLLRLRQICCDPRLVEGGDGHWGEADSAKLQALVELARQLVDQGSRVLVFSQFTSMLELMVPALAREGLDCLTLTGSTRDRGAVVRAFQEGETPLFLISLRAGGAGLNLTAADCVIHYDPWWNPAVERQASDRVHRMGQDKPVFIYKLLVDDSIESRIQHLQRTKLALVEGLLTEGDVERLEIDEETLDYLLGD